MSSSGPGSRGSGRSVALGPCRDGAPRAAAALARPLRRGSRLLRASRLTCRASDADVIVVGAGIMGLAVCSHLLVAAPTLRVLCVDGRTQNPGAATGAGQGYLWLAHRAPDSPAWELAVHSRSLWCQGWLRGDDAKIGDPGEIGWREAGSLLLGRDVSERDALAGAASRLQTAGLDAVLLDAGQLAQAEPALRALCSTGDTLGLSVRSDAQIGGAAAARALVLDCLSRPGFSMVQGAVARLELGAGGESIDALLLDDGQRLTAKRATVLTAGAWTGRLLAAAVGACSPAAAAFWAEELQPRRGLLLDAPWPTALPLLHAGMMEAGYAKHYAVVPANGPSGLRPTSPHEVDISFTATRGQDGRLLLGSSREFCGYDVQQAREATADAILERCRAFLPGLPGSWDEAAAAGATINVGLRPWCKRGLPHVGPVPGFQGLWMAAGHEGSGLLLAPASAQLLCDEMLGSTPRVSERTAQAFKPGPPGPLVTGPADQATTGP